MRESRRPTVGDVAEAAGVSKSTASRALSGSGYVSAAVQQRIHQAADQLGYVPDVNARNLRTGNVRDVGVVITNMRDAYYCQLATAVETALRALGYNMILATDDGDERLELSAIDRMLSMRVGGVILTPVSTEAVERLLSNGVKVVQVDRAVGALGTDTVLGANEQGAYEAAQLLLDHGHQRIAIVIDEVKWTTGYGRLAGFRRAFRDRGVRLDERLILFTSSNARDVPVQLGQHLDRFPDVTAIMAANGPLAEAAFTLLASRKLALPDQMSLMAYDDVPWMSMVWPPITTVDQHTEVMGRASAELLVKSMESGERSWPATHSVAPSLVIRASVRRVGPPVVRAPRTEGDIVGDARQAEDSGLADLRSRPWTLPRPGFPADRSRAALSITELRSTGLRICDAEVSLPSLVLIESAVTNNIRVMSDFLAGQGVLFAPHAKTAMAPQLMARQLDAGAWGITVANVAQARVAAEAGAPNILIANEVVGIPDAAWLAEVNERYGASAMVFVDSPESAVALDRGLERAGLRTPLAALVEVGWSTGRAGARGVDAAMAAAEAVRLAPRLQLAGVATYEGVVAHDRSAESIARIDSFLESVKAVATAVAEAGLFERDRAVVSAGGTRFVDRVVAILGPSAWDNPAVDVICRPGCYLTFGHGGADMSAFAPGSPWGELVPTTQLWAEVLSLPEPGLAIVGVGKRTAGERQQALVPLALASSGGLSPVTDQMSLQSLDDQHGYLRFKDLDLGVGDRIVFGVLHPAALDRFRVVPVIDDDLRLVDAVVTFYG